MEMYVPRVNTWAFVAPMVGSFKDIAAATGSDGNIYVFDGIGSIASTAIVLIYSPGASGLGPALRLAVGPPVVSTRPRAHALARHGLVARTAAARRHC